MSILWIEDDEENLTVEDCKSYVTKELERRGYIPKIENKADIASAIQYISDNKNRVDLIVTDYNLDDGDLSGGLQNVKNGLGFIAYLRSRWKNLAILYTNADVKEVKDDYKSMLDAQPLALFSNVFFVPLEQERGHIEANFKDAIDYFTFRWDELNAIRARYITEHAEIEESVRNVLLMIDPNANNYNYCDLINQYRNSLDSKNTLSLNDKITFKKWHESRKRRNALAHVSEEYDNNQKCYYIVSDSDPNIKLIGNEIEIIKYRLELSGLKKEVNSLIKKHEI